MTCSQPLLGNCNGCNHPAGYCPSASIDFTITCQAPTGLSRCCSPVQAVNTQSCGDAVGQLMHTADGVHVCPVCCVRVAALQFWVGYTTDEDGSLVSEDHSTVEYVSSRLRTHEIANGCVFGDKMRNVTNYTLSPDFNTFGVSSDCEEPRPYLCEQSSCTLCDACISRMYQNVSANSCQRPTISLCQTCMHAYAH